MRFDLSETEFADLETAAARAGVARGAFAAQVVLAHVRGTIAVAADDAARDALGELIRAAGLVRRIGANLNQAVAKLNATGQRSGDLLPYAAESMRRVERLDDVAEQVRKTLRVTSPQAMTARVLRYGPPSGTSEDGRNARSGRPSGSPGPRGWHSGERGGPPGRAEHGPDDGSGGADGQMIGKISAPRGKRVEPLIWYLFGPGRREEHIDPHIVAGWRHPAALEPPLRADGTRDLRKLNGLLNQPNDAHGQAWRTSGRCGTARCAPPPATRPSATMSGRPSPTT